MARLIAARLFGRSDRSAFINAIGTSPAMNHRGSALPCSGTAAGELLSTDDIAGRVIAAKDFDAGDAILRGAVREQVGSTVNR